MKLAVIAAAVSTLTLLAANAAQAGAGQFEVRVRATHLSPANESAPVGGTGKADRLHVSSKTIPEIDVSYFFTPSIAAELVLTVPQKHDVTLDGARIGSFRHLPPTLLAQYHFMPERQINPYLGAGVNITRIGSVHLLGDKAGLESHSVGLAVQAGVNLKLDQHWTLNADIKKIRIRSDVTMAGAAISHVKVDPVLVALGVGYRF